MNTSAHSRRTKRSHAVARFQIKPFVCLLSFLTLTASAVLALTVGTGPIRAYLGGAAEAAGKIRSSAEEHSEGEAILEVVPTLTSMQSARTGHTATLLSDGRVLIAGGNAAGSVEIFDPVTDVSSSAASLNAARSGHTATRLADGRVLIAGGRVAGDAVGSTEVFDPAAGSFSAGPPMGAARSGHTATTLANGSILIAGGGSDSAEIFDGATFTAVTGQMTASRTNASAIRMNDGRIFLAGGNGSATAEIFDPANGTFTAAGNPMKLERSRALLRTLPDGKVQIIGGNGDGSMEVYDPAIDTIGAYAHVVPESDPCANLINYVLAAETRAALIFNGSTAPERDRSGHTITELGSTAVVIGGTSSGGAALDSIEEFASSNATVTTDKLDYQPGQTVTVSGTGFEPGETVIVKIHEDPHTVYERGLIEGNPTADANGNFSGTYLVQEYDLNMKFVLGARGQTSGRTAQTTFTDNRNWDFTVLGSGSGSVLITVNIGTISIPPPCGTVNSSTSVTVTSTCTPDITTTDNGATVTFTATANPGSTFGGWSGLTNLTPNSGPGSCTGTNNPCSGVFGGGGALSVTFNANANTSTAVASSANPSVFGQNVTLTATVTRTSGSGVPSGSVQFIVDGSNFGAPVAVAGVNATQSTAATSTSSLAVGTHTVSANYIPTGGFNASSGALTPNQVVNKANTTTTLTSDHVNPLAWSQIFPTGTGPSSSTCAQTSHADGEGRLVVYARSVCGGGIGQVWVLNNANGIGSPAWSLVASGGPARHGQTTVYDEVGNNLILFGGCSGGCLPVNNDVWVLSNANGQGGPAVWTQITGITGGPPAPRNHAAGAYDPATNRLMIYGGQNGGGSVVGATFSDVWVLTNANTAGGSHAWTQLATSGTFPLGVYQPRAFYDSANNRLTVAGGARSDTGAASSAVNVLTNANGTGGSPAWTNLIAEGAAGAPAFAGWHVTQDTAANRGILAQQSSSNLYNLNNANGLGGPTSYTLVSPSGGGGATPGYGLGYDGATARTMAWHLNGSTNTSFVLAPASSSTYGDSVTFTANVSVTAPGAGTPAGNVQFFDGATPIGAPQPLSGGAASLVVSSLDAGVHNITAQYVGNSSFNASTSAVLPHSVAKKTLTVTADDQTISYGDADPTFTFDYSGGFVPPDTDADIDTPPTCGVIGLHTAVNTYPIVCSGGSDDNYDFSYVAGSLTVGTRAVTATLTANDKEYDGTTTEPDANMSCTFANVIPADSASVLCTATSGSFNTKDVATANLVTATVTLSGAAAGNYTLGASGSLVSSTGASDAANITAKALTASIIGNPTKVYDGNTNAVLTPANFSLATPVAGEGFTVTQTVGTYNDANVALATTVTAVLAAGDFTPTGTTLASNYSLPTSASGPGAITKATPTVSVSFGTSPITFDGLGHAATVTVNGVSGPLAIPGDGTTAITYTKDSLPFVGTPKDAGTYTADAAFTSSNTNYNNASSAASTSLVINKANAVCTIVGYTGVYDANPHGASGSCAGVAADPTAVGSSLTLGATFTNVPGGSATWNFTGGTNYNDQSDTVAIVINKADAVCTIVGFTGVFDANPHGASGSCVGVAADPTAVGSSLSLGTQYTNVPGGSATWTFTGGTNYNDQSASVAIVINKADAVCTIVGFTGVYDANPHGASGSCAGVAADPTAVGSSLTLGATFTNVPGGSATWNFTGGTNYNDQSDTVAIVINKADAVCTIAGFTGVFDANPHGASGSCAGVAADPTAVGSSLSLGSTFTNVPGGNATWTFTGGTNYNDQSASVAIVINKADAVCTIVGFTGVYDANPHGASGSCVGVAADPTAVGSSLSLGTQYTNVPGGSATWTFTGGTNYNDQSASVAIVINKADSVCTIVGFTGVYDANPHGASGSCVGVAADPTAAGSSLSLGTQYTNVPGGSATWTFTGGTNYNDQSASVAIVINKADAVCTIVGYSAIYDANPHGASGSCTGVAADPTAVGSSLDLGASFTHVPGGTATWSFTGGMNYNDQSDSVAIVIDKATLTITAVTNTKPYDGNNTAAAIPTYSGQLGTDTVTALAEVYDNKHAGTGKTLTVSAYTVNDGNGGNNYDVVTVDNTTGVITKVTLTLTAVTNTKTYDGDNSAAAVPTIGGLQTGDTVTGLTETYDNKNVGTGKTLSVATYTVNDGNGGNNYNVATVANNTGVINQKSITVTAVNDTKVYDGNTTSTGTPSISPGLAGTDTPNFTQSFSTKHFGIGNKTLIPAGSVNDGNGGNNYLVSFNNFTAGTINKLPITVTAVAATKVFDGNTSSTGIPTIAPSLVGGDTPNFIQTYDTQFVGTGKTLTPSGTANDGNTGLNYSYTFVPVNTGVITTIYCFSGFHSPIGGSVESGNGGTYTDPVRSFKLNSTIPIKFTLFAVGCGGTPITTGIHTLQMIKYTSAVDSDPAIDATPTDAATTGNQFRLTGTEWHYNLDTKRTPGLSAGTWLIKATLLDGSVKTVWVSIKK
jgi:hypothetical protein